MRHNNLAFIILNAQHPIDCTETHYRTSVCRESVWRSEYMAPRIVIVGNKLR
jgi:hypothetical protein